MGAARPSRVRIRATAKPSSVQACTWLSVRKMITTAFSLSMFMAWTLLPYRDCSHREYINLSPCSIVSKNPSSLINYIEWACPLLSCMKKLCLLLEHGGLSIWETWATWSEIFCTFILALSLVPYYPSYANPWSHAESGSTLLPLHTYRHPHLHTHLHIHNYIPASTSIHPNTHANAYM